MHIIWCIKIYLYVYLFINIYNIWYINIKIYIYMMLYIICLFIYYILCICKVLVNHMFPMSLLYICLSLLHALAYLLLIVIPEMRNRFYLWCPSNLKQYLAILSSVKWGQAICLGSEEVWKELVVLGRVMFLEAGPGGVQPMQMMWRHIHSSYLSARLLPIFMAC